MKVKREGYTFGAGALVGLMASNRPLYIFAAGLVAGLALGAGVHFYHQVMGAFRSLGRRITSRHEPGLSAAPRPVYDSRRKHDGIPF